MRLMVFFIAFGLSALQAHASSRVNGLPNFQYDMPAVTLHQFVLGESCRSLPSLALDYSCNPAFLSIEEKRQFRVDLTLNDRLKTVNEYRRLLQRDDTIGIVDSVLGRRDPLIAQAAGSLWYQRDWWLIGYTPFRAGLAEFTRNPAYPEVGAHVYLESEVYASGGFTAADDKNLRFGATLRYVDRKFFRETLAVLDAVGDPSLLRTKKQKAVYLEPGVTYTFDGSWESAVSATLTNVRVFQHGEHTKWQPVLDAGFSTAPPFGRNKLRTVTHITTRPDAPDFFSRVSMGATYEIHEIVSLSGSLGTSSAGIGINGHIDSVVLGVGYRTQEINPDQWQSKRVSSALFEFGLVF